MITSYRKSTLGTADYGWLQARYHFSFSRYYNPKRRGFGRLLVINDDMIAAGRGFEAHGHDNMEIITYVRSGAITHRDSLGNEGRTAAGDVQVMSAGSGVVHEEHNRESEPTTLYQIWIEPQLADVVPRWESRQFPKDLSTDRLPLLVSGRAEDQGNGVLFIHQDAAIYGGRVAAGSPVFVPIKHQAYVLVSAGEGVLNQSVPLYQGDGAEVVAEENVTFTATTEAEILVIDVPQ